MGEALFNKRFGDFHDRLCGSLMTFDDAVALAGFAVDETARRRWNSWAVNWNSDNGVHEYERGQREPIRTYGVMALVFLICSLPRLDRATRYGYIQWYHIEKWHDPDKSEYEEYLIAVAWTLIQSYYYVTRIKQFFI